MARRREPAVGQTGMAGKGRRPLRERSVSASFFLTYLTVFGLLLVVTIGVCLESARSVEVELQRANDALLSQLRRELDTIFGSAVELGLQMGLNPRLRPLLYSKQPLTDDQYYEIVRLVDEFEAYKTLLPFVHSFYVYLGGSEGVIAFNAHADPLITYRASLRYRELDYGQWLGLMKRPHSRYFVALSVEEQSGPRPVVACLQSLPPESQVEAIATCVVSIDAASIAATISRLPWVREGGVAVIQRDDTLIYSTSPSLPVLGYREVPETPGRRRYASAGTGLMVFSAPSSVPGLKYLAYVPLELFWGRLHHVRRLVLVATSAVALLGLSFLVLFPRRFLRPLRSLVGQLSADRGLAQAPTGDEYRFIANTIQAIMGEKDAAMEKLGERDARLRDDSLVELLTRGRAAESSEVREAPEIPSPYVVLLVTSIEVPEFLERDGPSVNARLNLARTLVSSVLAEIEPPHGDTRVFRTGEQITAVLGVVPRAEETEDEWLQSLADAVRSGLAQGHGIRCTVSMSAPHERPEELGRAYAEAQEAASYGLLREREHVFLYTQGGSARRCGYYYPLHVEEKLINCMAVGDRERAAALLDALLDLNLGSSSLSVAGARCLLSDLAGTLMKAGGELDPPAEGLSLLSALGDCAALSEARAILMEYMEGVCERAGRNGRAGGLSAVITRYVERNLHDINLNVNAVANALGLTPAYVSRSFRAETGTRLLEHINRRRVGDAKSLLDHPELTIAEVAGRVGFSGSNALIRWFKRYEGVTPGRLKETASAAREP